MAGGLAAHTSNLVTPLVPLDKVEGFVKRRDILKTQERRVAHI
jgi:hypothetical protein